LDSEEEKSEFKLKDKDNSMVTLKLAVALLGVPVKEVTREAVITKEDNVQIRVERDPLDPDRIADSNNTHYELKDCEYLTWLNKQETKVSIAFLLPTLCDVLTLHPELRKKLLEPIPIEQRTLKDNRFLRIMSNAFDTRKSSIKDVRKVLKMVIVARWAVEIQDSGCQLGKGPDYFTSIDKDSLRAIAGDSVEEIECTWVAARRQTLLAKHKNDPTFNIDNYQEELNSRRVAKVCILMPQDKGQQALPSGIPNVIINHDHPCACHKCSEIGQNIASDNSILSLAVELLFVRWLHEDCHMKITNINNQSEIDPLQAKVSNISGSAITIIEGKEVNTALCACPVYCYPDPPEEIRRRLEVYNKLAIKKAAELQEKEDKKKVEEKKKKEKEKKKKEEEKKKKEEKKNSKNNKKKAADNKQKK
jgi:hypothetical protein